MHNRIPDENCTRKKYQHFVNQFIHFDETVTFLYKNMMESTWRRFKSDRIWSDERFHIGNLWAVRYVTHEFDRSFFSNVHISQRTNHRPNLSICLSVNHTLKHHPFFIWRQLTNKQTKLKDEITKLVEEKEKRLLFESFDPNSKKNVKKWPYVKLLFYFS